MRSNTIILLLALCTLAPSQETEKTVPRNTNRLVDEKSPYLQQHAHNPVDWWPWCDEAFASAKKRDVPVFLSIGYSTCHWCHVMEHESFENEEIAAYMNEHYVCIKVDREERPDVDRMYMEYIQMVSGNGGWPASIWLTPERKPFYAGTYFPPKEAFGRPGFTGILKNLHEVWSTRRKDVENAASRAIEALKEKATTNLAAEIPAVEVVAQAIKNMTAMHDSTYGGFGQPPKFPRTSVHELLLRRVDGLETDPGARAASHSLEQMSRGGIYDHVGGGIHRYSTDAVWLVPHFEKMLYDQALVAHTYIQCAVQAGNTHLNGVAEDIFSCVLRDFRHENGAFMGSYDADSGGREGTYYLWSSKELDEVLDKKTRSVLEERFDISNDGNWHEVPGSCILAIKKTWEQVGEALGMEPSKAESLWQAARPLLIERRNTRAKPGLDDKIITSWNGMMISTLAHAGRILGNSRYVDAAGAAAGFILESMRKENGDLWRRWCKGESAFDGVLNDYAWMSRACIDLFEATGSPRWLIAARDLADRMNELFEDKDGGGWFDSRMDAADLLVRTKEPYDGAIPSGNSVAMDVSIRLAALTGRKDYIERAETALRCFKEQIERAPHAYPLMLQSVINVRGLREIVVVGDPKKDSTRSLREKVNSTWLPDTVICFVTDKQAREGEKIIPLLAGRSSVDGEGVAFVCRNGVCKTPVRTVEELTRIMEQ